MSNETIWKQSTSALAISSTATVASNGFNSSAEITSLSSTQTGKYPYADAVFSGSFSTSVSSNSNMLILYRRDLNIEGAGDAPIPQSAAPAYSAVQVGAIPVPPFTAASTAILFFPDVQLSAQSDCEFYLENRTNASIVSGFSVKIYPKTYAPAP